MKTKLLLSSLIFVCFINAYSQTTYYSKSAGNLNAVATWGTNTNGTGTAPANFTTAGCTYIIVNNAAATINGGWIVSGAGSVVQVGDGTQAINFTIPTTGADKLTGTVNVMSSSTLTINNPTSPTFGTLASGSTVVYSDAANQTMNDATYYNLTLGGSGTKKIVSTANATVTNILNISTGVVLSMNTSTADTLTLNGTITGAGTITGGTNANLNIGGTGNFGTIIPTASPITFNNLNLNRGGLGSVTLGGSATLQAGNFSNGVLVLNGNTLILQGAFAFPASPANGSITGNAAANLSITATTITNNLIMTSGAQTLHNLTLNSAGQTLTLGNDLTVSGAYLQTKGIVNINGNTLSLTGTAQFASTAANGTTTGSSSSSLLISTTAITNSLFLTGGAQTFNNFTLNTSIPAAVLTIGAANSLTVSGAFTHTGGTLKLNGNTLTLNGTATFPTSASNGVITGSATSGLALNATSYTNSLFMDQTTVGTTNEVKTFTLNSPSATLTLGNNLQIASGGTYTHTNGTINLNGNALTLNGSITFPALYTNGFYTGSSTSSILIGGAVAGTITNSLLMDQTSSSTSSLSNLTFNRNTKTIPLGNNLNVIDSISPTKGTIAGGGNITLIADQVNVGHAGRIAKVGGSITGNITSQVYHNPPPGNTTNWTLMGSAGVTNATFAQWGSSFQITCRSGCSSTGPSGGAAFNSITTYNGAWRFFSHYWGISFYNRSRCGLLGLYGHNQPRYNFCC